MKELLRPRLGTDISFLLFPLAKGHNAADFFINREWCPHHSGRRALQSYIEKGVDTVRDEALGLAI